MYFVLLLVLNPQTFEQESREESSSESFRGQSQTACWRGQDGDVNARGGQRW